MNNEDVLVLGGVGGSFTCLFSGARKALCLSAYPYVYCVQMLAVSLIAMSVLGGKISAPLCL